MGYALFFRAGSADFARFVYSDGSRYGNYAYCGYYGRRPASMDSPTY